MPVVAGFSMPRSEHPPDTRAKLAKRDFLADHSTSVGLRCSLRARHSVESSSLTFLIMPLQHAGDDHSHLPPGGPLAESPATRLRATGHMCRAERKLSRRRSYGGCTTACRSITSCWMRGTFGLTFWLNHASNCPRLSQTSPTENRQGSDMRRAS